MKICVIIPTYNEAKGIGKLVREIRNFGLDTLVIDDGSTDNTAQIAQSSGAQVIINKKNQGKGYSLIEGFDYALKNNFDAVVTMDGDGQHVAEEIPAFLKAAQDLNPGIVVGNRMQDAKNMPLIRILTNKFMSSLISMVAKQKIPDTQCGFRLIKKEVLKKARFSTARFETESEILIEASRLGFKIVSVKIKSVYSGEKSQINPFIDTLRFFRFIFRKL